MDEPQLDSLPASDLFQGLAEASATVTATATMAIATALDSFHSSPSLAFSPLPTPFSASSIDDHHTSPNSPHIDSSFWLVRSVLSGVMSLLQFLTMSLPASLYHLLSWSFTLQLTFTTLFVAMVLVCLATYAVVRYRVLTKYSRLPKALADKHGSSFDLHPDNPAKARKDEKDRLSYPDEFLSAFLASIKIFGYLEQPVFHELARHLQTKRILAGDTLLQTPELETSFYIVVDGCVQVYEQLDPDERDQEDEEFDDDIDQNYRLLNEVRNGGTLSSLFTILSLFTESVKLRHDDEPLKEFKRSDSHYSASSQRHSHSRQARGSGHDSSRLDEPLLDQAVNLNTSVERRVENAAIFPHIPSLNRKKHSSHRKVSGHTPTSPLSNPNHMSVFANNSNDGGNNGQDQDEQGDQGTSTSVLDTGTTTTTTSASSASASASSASTTRPTRPGLARSHSSLYESRPKRNAIVARAMVDTTLAVIPAEAFHRLTQKFPQAAAHIVQVILIRFQRVTLLTGHKYLGLTKELLRMERSMNDIASYGLPPDFFRPRTMNYLRDKFSNVGSIGGAGGISTKDRPALVNNNSSNNHNNNNSNIGDDAETSDENGLPLSMVGRKKRRQFGGGGEPKIDDVSLMYSPRPTSSRMSSMGDNEHGHVPHGAGFSALVGDNEEEDSYLRDQVMECLSRSIGLVQTPPKNTNLRADIKPTTQAHDAFSAIFAAHLGHSTSPHHHHHHHEGGEPMRKSGSGANSEQTLLDDLNNISSTSSGVPSSVPSVMSEMDNDVEIMFFPGGATLVQEGERNAGLFFVIDGMLDVTIPSKKPIPKGQPEKNANVIGKSMTMMQRESVSTLGSMASSNRSRRQGSTSTLPKPRPLFSIEAGGLAGYLAALSGYPSFVTITARRDTYVGFLSKASLDRVLERNPTVLLTLAKRLITLVPPVVLQLDYAMEWMQVSASQVLHRQGDDSDSIYIVLNGRLRTIKENSEGKIEILGEFSQGESVGELEVLMGTPFPTTLHAIRDTEVARMPKSLFNTLAQRHPEITIRISRLIAQRANDALINGKGVTPDSAINNSNLRTVGILPVSSAVPVTEFADRLLAALVGIGATASLLNHSTVMNLLGKHAFSKFGNLKLDNWLNEQESSSQIVLYLADGGVTSPWTQTCVRQSDCILLVGHGDDDPAIGDYERLLVSMKTTARKELVLLHANRHCAPGSTAAWLKSRIWVHAHHHIQMPFKGPTMLGDQARKNTIMNLKDHLEKFYSHIRHNNTRKSPAFTGNRSDFARLARRLTGKTVGLVLGGGGARGIAHIGVIKALEEAGIPIDIVGGTSMGAFIGGLYARESDNVAIFGRAKMFSGRMAAKWRMAIDLTYPVTSWTTGHEFNRGIWKCFSDTQIQDLWLSYYCNTTNITFSRMEMHQAGYAWRYIRASMSLSGFLPPLIDNGHMLVDGGYMDNLPVEFMKSLGAQTIFAVDVASDDDTSLQGYGDSLSGWLVLINRWNPFSSVYRKIPNLADIQSRLAYVSSVKQLEQAKATPGMHYFKPPVQSFGTLEFNRFDEIFEAGYEYGKDILAKWEKEGALGDLITREKSRSRKSRRIRRNSI